MRNWMTIINENDSEEQAHYDALEQTGFYGDQGAGVILKAKSTGRFLLVLRSSEVEQPFTWGNLGGAHHASEQPIDAAKREAKEETRFTGDIEMIPAYVFIKGTFRYSNFIGLIDEEFVPTLNWEADDYRWVSMDDLPQPLHFGMEALFNDPASYQLLAT